MDRLRVKRDGSCEICNRTKAEDVVDHSRFTPEGWIKIVALYRSLREIGKSKPGLLTLMLDLIESGNTDVIADMIKSLEESH